MLAYYDTQGSAYSTIKLNVEGSAKKKRILTNPGNPSAHDILDISLVELRDDEALVKTKEYWYLRWYDIATKDYISYVYKETNEQIYLLVWKNGHWLIKSNAYPPSSDNDTENE
ncbi:hypothetical protein [Arundinibacter roseus]|uniref:Uncharacterized protein n=1 Tax=Arundinibacter roseus TaxID=2070510 RepID=A0A4R4KR82_9BACT|nr:hypothetical protein [Arundinibacter roseus]TDB69169.1 hypothetical protein EZE20_02195 [Arundinibacter roseus]